MTAPADGPTGYRIVQTIGHGASSTVYEAIQNSTGRRVALKVVAASMPGGDAERVFTRERSVLAELGEHAHIVSIVDAGQWDGRFWLAMEYCPYGSVAMPGERLDVPDVVAVLTGVGSALEVAHREGLVHRDVKPANILRNRYGSPALADFGIATFVLATGQGSTATGYTLDHASPEAIDGERPTSASDVWSLGTSLWELLEGRPPFRLADEVSQSAVIRRICFDPTPPLTRDDVPEDLAALIDEMTMKAPAERPSVVEVLERARELETVVGAPDPERWSQTIFASPAPTPDRPHDDASTAAAALGSTDPAMTYGGPSPEELTNFRPQARHPASPPVLGEPEPVRRRSRPWLIAAAAVLVVVLMGGGGAVTWRLANAASASAPVVAAAPTTTSTTPTPPVTTAPPPVVVADSGGEAAPTVDDVDAPQSEESPDEVTTSEHKPEPTPEKKAGIDAIQLSGTTCRASGNTCSSTTTSVSFSVKVTDTDGNVLSDGCTATTTLSKPGKKTSTYGKKACGARVAVNANGSGDYVIEVNASWNGSSRSKSFRLIVE